MFGKKTFISVIFIGILAYYSTRPKNVRLGKLVESKSGAVQGIISVSRDGRDFYEWAGIPYAKPPVGNLRFASPQPIEKWTGIRDGSKHGSQCVQNAFFSRSFKTGDEDCLFLNVYKPKLNDDTKALPVLFYIHGGAYTIGSSDMYRPEFFMDEDVVFVSIQYRVDIFGFLSTGDKVIRGNMGLKDQALGLKWVQENIRSFGGDPNKVTILGHSAGGASVHQLLLSPITKGLFQKAISHSGAASNTWGFKSPVKSVEKTKAIAKALSCPVHDNDQLAQCLRGKSAQELIDTVYTDLVDSPLCKPHKFGEPTVPTIELVDDEEAFLTQHPLDVVAQGKAHRVPWMVGFTADEGLLSTIPIDADDSILKEQDEIWEASIKSVFAIDSSKNLSASEKAAAIRDFYFPPSQRSSLSREDKLKAYTKLFGDAFFNFDIRESILYQRRFSKVYPYFYNKTDGASISNLLKFMFRGKIVDLLGGILYALKVIVAQSFFGAGPPQDPRGINHAGDMVYLFPLHPIIQMPQSSKHYKFSKSYVNLLVDFATKNETLDPTLRGVKFPATPKEGPIKFLDITNDVPKVITEPFEGRMQFLHDLKIRDSSGGKKYF